MARFNTITLGGEIEEASEVLSMPMLDNEVGINIKGIIEKYKRMLLDPD